MLVLSAAKHVAAVLLNVGSAGLLNFASLLKLALEPEVQLALLAVTV